MFTGIIEDIATLVAVEKEDANLHFWLKCKFADELKVDQSVAHNGVCLTVVELENDKYKVTAIGETLNKTNLRHLKKGDIINLERCLRVNDRLDGHIVQGHVDQTGIIEEIKEEKGSYILSISYDEALFGNITIEKGSICLNGISLTVIDSLKGRFSVAIIPYTWENTNLNSAKIGDQVNLEFDVLGKYIKRLMQK